MTRPNERPRGWSRTRKEQAAYMRQYRKRTSVRRIVDAILRELRPAITAAVRGMRVVPLVAAALLLAGCERRVVAWTEPERVPVASIVVPFDGALTVHKSGAVTVLKYPHNKSPWNEATLTPADSEFVVILNGKRFRVAWNVTATAVEDK